MTAAAVALLVLASAAFAGDEVVVGVVSTLGSPHQPDGGDVRSAVEDRAAALGSPSLVAGRLVRLEHAEDDCTRPSAERAARRLVAVGATVVIGHVCASAAIAAAPVYAAAGILFIAPSVRHPRLTGQRAGPLVFRLAGRSDRQGAAMAALAIARAGGQPTSIVHDKSAESTALADQIEKALVSGGQRPSLRESYVAAERRYDALVARIAAAGARAVLIPSQPTELGIMLRRFVEAGHRPLVIGSDALAVPSLEPVLKSYAGDIFVTLPWPPAQPGGASTVHRLAAAAFEVWAAAAARAGSSEPADVAKALTEQIASTGLGPLRFDADGDAVVPSYVPHAWRDGRWQALP